MAEETEGAEQKDKITKDMSIAEIVMGHPELAEVFMKHGMHCLGCAASRFENLEQGCMAHGIDPDALVKDLNDALENGDDEDDSGGDDDPDDDDGWDDDDDEDDPDKLD